MKEAEYLICDIAHTAGVGMAQHLREPKHVVTLIEELKEPTMVIHNYKLLLPTIYTPPLTRRERRALERKNK